MAQIQGKSGDHNLEEEEKKEKQIPTLKRGYERVKKGGVKLEGAFVSLEFREGTKSKKIKKHQLSSAEID